MTTIRVVDEVGPICVDPDDGDRFYARLKALFAEGGPVTLDFTGVTTLTSSFLNPSIGRLYGDFPADRLDRDLTCVGVDTTDADVIAVVRKFARDYYGRQSAGASR